MINKVKGSVTERKEFYPLPDLSVSMAIFMDNSNRLFRKAVFGGFNKDDVIDYIESMKNEFFEYRKQVEATIGELNKKISELEQAGNAVPETVESSFSDNAMAAETEDNELTNNVNFSVDEINAATNHLKETADKLCESLTDFMDKISTSCISVTVEAPVKNETDNSFVESIFTEPDEIPQEAAETPSPEEIAEAYRQALRMKGDNILASAFSQENKDEDVEASCENENEQSSTFSDLLDSILNAHEPKREGTCEREDKADDKSILDGLLSSSAFLN